MSTPHWEICSVGCGEYPRFGHTCSAVHSDAWGATLAVVFGGVASSKTKFKGHAREHAALDSLSVLCLTGSPDDEWFAPEPEGDMRPPARAFHAAAAVGQDVYIFGGHVLVTADEHGKKRRHFFNDLWKVDTTSWAWTLVLSGSQQEAPCARDMCTLSAVGESSSCGLILFGGRSESGRCVNDTWIFDISRCAWLPVSCSGLMPPPRKMHSAVVAGSRLLVMCGDRDTGVPLDDCWSLKLPQPIDHLLQQGHGGEELRWTPIKVRPCPGPRFGAAACQMPGERENLICMYGGCVDASASFVLSLTRTYAQTDECWMLDLASFSWSKVESTSLTDDDHSNSPGPKSPGSAVAACLRPSERMAHTFTALASDRVLLLGGRKKEGICQDAWWLVFPSTGPPSSPDKPPATEPLTEPNTPQGSPLPLTTPSPSTQQESSTQWTGAGGFVSSLASSVAQNIPLPVSSLAPSGLIGRLRAFTPWQQQQQTQPQPQEQLQLHPLPMQQPQQQEQQHLSHPIPTQQQFDSTQQQLQLPPLQQVPLPHSAHMHTTSAFPPLPMHTLSSPEVQALRVKLGLSATAREDSMTQQGIGSSIGNSHSNNNEGGEHMHTLRGMGWRVLAAQRNKGGEGAQIPVFDGLNDSARLIGAARSQLSCCEPESVTLGEVRVIAQDLAHLVRERSRVALTEADKKEGVKDAKGVLDQMMSGVASVGFAHLASSCGGSEAERVVRLGEVPALLRAYKSEVASGL